MRSTTLIRLFSCTLGCLFAASTYGQNNEPENRITLGDLLEAGQILWEENAPADLQEQYHLPTVEEVETFLGNIEADLAEGNIQRLAAYAPEAKLALLALRNLEGGEPLADWLEPRVDFLIAAQGIEPQPPAAPPSPSRPKAPAPPAIALAPQYTQPYWDQKLAARPRPPKADRYMPVFKKAFAAKGVPPELAWLAEVESSLNLKARSPVGAYGPFQFMPATAKRFGLHTGFPDDRSHPRKSAEAAASYLAILYQQFQSWPLAIAAYNAGEGRVGRALKDAGSSNFDSVSAKLPAETRMYVPKVLATIALRESIDPAQLPGL